jgi:peptidoglycan/xylan/chitin deacetylase (PgdA/CDA1 family)
MNYEIQPGTSLDDFESLSGWAAGAGGAVALSSDYVKEASNALKLTVNAGTANVAFDKTVSWDLSDAGNISFWVYVPTLNFASSWFVVYLSSVSNFSKYFSYGFASVLHEGWNKLTIPRSAWTNGGGEDWENVMIRFRVRVYANGTDEQVVYLDDMKMGVYSRPKVAISFDDGWESVYTIAYPYMKARGIRGTLFIIESRINTAGYMTTAMLQELFDNGWDICNHTVNHINMSSYTEEQAYEELVGCRDWIRENGWDRNNSASHVAYPNGGYGDGVLAAMESLGMITGRTIINRCQSHEIDHRYLLTRQSHGYTATQATYRGWITRAIREGQSLEPNYHKIIVSGGTADTEVYTSQFCDLIDFAYLHIGQLDFVTRTEWYRELTNARKLI